MNVSRHLPTPQPAEGHGAPVARDKHRPRKLQLLRLLPDAWVTTTGARSKPTLYLTFDDGPHPEHTAPLLDVLARHDAKATFFLVGRHIERHPELARRIAEEGHALGNHSYSHPHFDRLGLPAQLEEVDRTERLLGEIDGRTRHSFRPPRGVTPRPMLTHFIRQGRHIAYWSYDSLDYSRRPAESLAASMREDPPRSGDVILMHDDSRIATDMLDALIPAWKAAGFAFDVLSTK